MKVYKLTYENNVVEYYPQRDGNNGTYLDSAWNGTIIPIKTEEIDLDELWLVDIEIREWDESESVWKLIKKARVSPYRLTEEESIKDFEKIGCVDSRSPYKHTTAQRIIIPCRLDITYLVQRVCFDYLKEIETI